MKKSLVALAALAVAGVASAQSSVTLFGIVDAAVSGYSTKSELVYTNPFALPPIGVPGSLKRSQSALSNSGYNSSRLGFRGTEDLGGGLAASFWLEAPITNDDGKGGVSNFARRSTVSLSGGFGEIRLGRDYTATFWNDTVFDPFGTNGVGTNLIFRTSSSISSALGGSPNGAAGSDNYVRTSNAIAYFLPPNLGGFYGQFQYALHENVKSDELANSPSKAGRYVGGRFGYANGPLDVAVAYAEDTKADSNALYGFATTDNKIKTFNLGASYDFGPVKLFGELSQVKNSFDASVVYPGLPSFVFTQGNSSKMNGALLGVTVPVGPGLIRASYGKVKYNAPDQATFDFFNTNRDASAQQFAVGYVHNLSKRTALYATVARISIKDGQNSAIFNGVTTGGSPLYGAITGYSYAPKTATGYDFGIRHAF